MPIDSLYPTNHWAVWVSNHRATRETNNCWHINLFQSLLTQFPRKKDKERKKLKLIYLALRWSNHIGKKILAEKFFFNIHCHHIPPYYKVKTNEVYIASKHISKEEKKTFQYCIWLENMKSRQLARCPRGGVFRRWNSINKWNKKTGESVILKCLYIL